MDVTFQAIIERRKLDEASITQGGNLRLSMDKQYGELLINKLKTYKGQVVSVKITDTESWTERMNRLFHALIRDIMSHDAVQYWQLLGRAPSGFDEIKEWCKVQFGGSEVKIVGSLSFIESWTKFGKKRALQTIDNIIKYLIEQGIDIDAHKIEMEDLK